MQDSKLIKILKTFSAAEMKEFEYFVNSPYFSRGRDFSVIFSFIKSCYPEFDSNKCTQENLFSRLYPGKKYSKSASSSIIYTLSSELFKLCKEYLVQTGLNEDYSRRKFYLLNKLREKKLYKEFEKEYKTPESGEENFFRGGPLDFLNKFYLTHAYLEYCVESVKPSEAFDSILKLGEYSGLAALIYGYRNPDLEESAKTYNLTIRDNLIDNMIENIDSDKLLEKLKNNDDNLYPYAAVNYAAYLMSVYPNNDKYYFDFKKLIDEYIDLFGFTEKYILYSILGSNCTRKIQSDNSDVFIREDFEIHKKTVELGLIRYNKNDKINLNRFRNIVLSAFDVNEIDWLENFVSNHLQEIESDLIENMRFYSNAYIHFGKKDYDKALECLIKVNHNFSFIKLDVKHLTLLIYYELGYLEQAYSIIDTIRHFISNTKNHSEDYKNAERHFLRIVNELLKIRTSETKDNVNIIESELKRKFYITSKNWLLKKINELKQGK